MCCGKDRKPANERWDLCTAQVYKDGTEMSKGENGGGCKNKNSQCLKILNWIHNEKNKLFKLWKRLKDINKKMTGAIL
ncbi:hypothetical protein AV530_011945 [Patagioenas fasciata monilis]|uniref:Uncharacterized protein n=1 Tax=Patagioenas fasciata monilis TaxID=372326 RepID=A0A1V4JUJ0_PATFA|nr:hypothetical protein AV530_011945 [Patagioenas fasciata monilis]